MAACTGIRPDWLLTKMSITRAFIDVKESARRCVSFVGGRGTESVHASHEGTEVICRDLKKVNRLGKRRGISLVTVLVILRR